MAFKGTLVFFLTCQLNICCVMAAECTTAIIASVFGTIGSLVVIALVAVAIWYYCKQRQSASLSSTSSADSVSDPGFSFGGKTKGGQIGLDGNGTPMTFSDHYSEKAPSVAYNTSGVVNPAFSHSRDVVLDIPPGDDEEVKIDMDGGASIKPPDYNKNVNIGGEGESRIRKPSGSSDVKLDMDWDSRHDDVLPSTSGHALDLPGIKPPGSGSGLQGADVDVTVMGASYPKYDDGAVGEIGLETREVFLERPGRGGFGLLIARDKTLPPPALFIREVTPGGIAAKTGFVDKGDKIIGINGVSIEGMPHEKAMELLRDDTRPLLNLRLSKNAMNMEKGGFLDVPGGSIEESCSVDAAPSVEASPPTVQFETVQGDAPTLGQMGLTVTKPNVGTTKAPLDLSEGNLDMRVSGPNGLSSTDIRGPSVGVANLPSKRKKSAKCLSCTSSGDVDEPYGKRSGKQEINLDGSDVTISGKGKMTDFESNGSDVNNAEKPKTDLEVNSSRPERYLSNDGMHSLSAGVDKPSNNKKIGNCFSCVGGTKHEEPYRKRRGKPDLDIDENSGSIELKTGQKFDLSGSGPNIPGTESEVKTRKLGFGASSSASDFDVEDSNLDIKASKPDVELDVNAPDITSPKAKSDVDYSTGNVRDLKEPSAQLNLPPSKRKHSNCFTCSGIGDKDEPYRKSQGNTGYALDGSKFDAAMEMKDVSGPTVGTSRADSDAPDAEIKASMAAHDVGLSTGQPRKQEKKGNEPSADLGLRSSNKKRENCFSCAGGVEKDEPYTTTRGETSFHLNEPDVDESIHPSGSNADISGPNVDNQGLKINVDKPDLEIDEQNLDLPKPQVNMHGEKPRVQGFKTDASGPGSYFSGSNVDTSAGMSGLEFDISENKPVVANGEDMEISARESTAAVNANLPEIDAHGGMIKADYPLEMGPPSVKKRRAKCFSCVGGVEKDEPYKTTRGQTTLDFNGSEVDGSIRPRAIHSGVSVPKGDTSQLRMKATQPDFEINQLNTDLSGPHIDIRGPNSGVSKPDFDVNRPSLDISAGTSGPELDIPGSRPIDENGEELDFVTGPPKAAVNANLDAPKASTKTEFLGLDFESPAGQLRGSKATVDRTSAEFGLPSRKKMGANCFSCTGGAEKDEPYKTAKGQTSFDLKGPELDGSMRPVDIDAGVSEPEVSAIGPKMTVAKSDNEIDQLNADFSVPGIGKQRPHNGVSELDFDGSQPDLDFSLEKSGPNLNIVNNREDFEISGSRPEAALNAKLPQIDQPEARVKTDFSGSDLDFPAGQSQGQKGTVHEPSAQLGVPSLKRKRANCFSCAGSAEKDEPYKTATGQTTFDLRGPDVRESVQPITVRPGVSGPNVNVEGGLNVNAAKPDFEIDQGKSDLAGPQIDVEEPNFDAIGPKTFVTGPEVDVAGSNVDLPARISGPEYDIPEKKPVSANGDNLKISAREPRAAVNANLPEIDAPEASIEADYSATDFDLPSGPLKGPKPTVKKQSAELVFPSTKKKRANCFSCAGGAEKDEPYKTTREQTAFDLNGPEIDGSIQPTAVHSGISGPKGDANGLKKVDIVKPDFESDSPNPAFSGPGVDIRGPNNDISRPDLGVSEPNLDISAGALKAGLGSQPAVKNGGELEISTRRPKADLDANLPEIDAPEGRIKTDFSGPGFDSSAGKFRSQNEAVHKPPAEFGLPSTKKKRANCFSCAGGAEKDEPYKTTRGQTAFDLNGPEVDGSMQPTTVLSGVSGLKDDATGLKIDIAKPDFESNRPNPAFSGPGDDIRGPNIGISRPDVFISEPNLDISAGPSGEGQESTPAVKNGGELEISTRRPKAYLDANLPEIDAPEASINTDFSGPGFDSSAGKHRSQKETVHKLSTELGLPSTKKRGANCFSCAGGADKDEPYKTTKRETGFDIKGPEFNGFKQPGAMSVGMNNPKVDSEIEELSSDFSGPDVDSDVPRFRGSNPDRTQLKIRETGAGVSASYSSGTKMDVSEPNIDVQVPKIGFDEVDNNVNGAGPKVSGREFDFAGPKYMQARKADVRLDASVRTPKGKSLTKMSAPDDPDGEVRDPKASADMAAAELSPPSGKVKGANCFSCAGSLDKDEPYRKTKGKYEFSLQGPNAGMEESSFVAGTFPSTSGGTNLHLPTFESTPSKTELPSGSTELDLKTHQLDFPKDVENGTIEVRGPTFSHKSPEISGASTGKDEIEFGTGRQDTDTHISLGEADWGFSNLNILGPKETIDLDFNLPDTDLPALKPSVDETKFDNDAPKAQFNANMPDIGVSTKKTNVECGIDELDNNVRGPDPDLSGLDVPTTRPSLAVNRSDMDIPDIPVGDLSYEANMPHLNSSGKEIDIGLNLDGLEKERSNGRLDIDANPPGVSIPERKSSLQVKGLDMEKTDLDYDLDISEGKAPFDWKLNKSTTNFTGPDTTLELDTEPLDGKIITANDSNLQLQSTPEPRPFVDYQEPRSLQRYDEIRPDMELRLMSPSPSEKPVFSSDLDSRMDTENSGKRMSLIKVEENIVLCSASLKEDDTRMQKRTLTLDREINQKIEIEFPEGKGFNEKGKSSTSSSSSTSSDSDSGTEDKPKKKKKFRLFKAFRKGSTSSTSSKGGETKEKGKGRKSSTSSSSSVDNKKNAKDPLRNYALSGKVTGKENADLFSSLEDPKVVCHKDLPKIENSGRSPSDSVQYNDEKKGQDLPAAEVTMRSTELPETNITLDPHTLHTPSLLVSNLVMDQEDFPETKYLNRSSSSSNSSDGGEHNDEEKAQDLPAPKLKFMSSTQLPQKDISFEAGTALNPSVQGKLDEVHESRISTSSSSSDEESDKMSDAEVDKEKSKRKKKKWRLFKSLRKDSTSSESSKEDGTETKQHESKKASSTSSSSSSDENERKEDQVRKNFHFVTPINNDLGDSKSSYGVSEPVKYNLEHIAIPTTYFASAEKKEPEQVPTGIPTVLSFTVNQETELKQQESSGSSSSDEEAPELSVENSKASMLYQVEYLNNHQKYIIEPHEDFAGPAAHYQEDGAGMGVPSVESRYPGSLNRGQTERKSSTSSSSSSDKEVSERKHSPSTHDNRPSSQATVDEHPVIVVYRSFKRPEFDNVGTTIDDHHEQQNVDIQHSELQDEGPYHLEYPFKIPSNEKVSDYHVKEDDITPVVKFKPNISVEIAPQDNANVDGGGREDFVSTTKEGHASPTWDLKSHTYQTVYHVTPPEKPVIHGESFEIPEVMPTVVRRSTKRILHDDDQEEDCPFVSINMDVELSEAANDFQLEYPETNDVFATNEKVSDNHVQQDDITPVVKFKPNISVEIAPHDNAKVDGGNREDFVSSAKEGHASPTWDLKSHTFETVYNVTAPEKRVIHGESFEIPEVMPTVVQRSTKRILYDDDQEEDCPFVSINTAVELSEATHDFQLEYPETNDVFTTNAHALKMTDDEWIVSHAFEKDKPDITALKASFDQPKEERRPRTNSTRSEDDKATTPTEKSYNDSTRRRSNSNSRLWELMQGYLIETPVMDDDENETDSEKTEEPKAKEIVHEEKVHEEKDNSESKLERTVFHVSLKPTKFETVSVPVQISDLNEPTNDNITPTFESDASQVKARNLEFHNDDDDPWMRHYSKGLQKGQQYSSSAKSPEKELSSTQNRGLSLSKVPHVKELRPSARKDRPSYSSESRIQTGQVVFRVGTEKSQDEKSNQEPGRASVSSLRSFWDK